MKQAIIKAAKALRETGQDKVAAQLELAYEKCILDVSELLKYLEDDSPVDFLGTGSDSEWANKLEKEWHEEFSKIRNLLGIRIY